METRQARHWVARKPGGLDVFDLVEFEVPEPGPGQVTIEIRAAGVNPADAKHVASGDFTGPQPVGYEVAGVLSAVGPDCEIASGGGAVGDPVLAFRISGGYATAVTVNASNVFARPATLDEPAAANLLLAGTTAAEMLDVAGVGAGDTIVLHGASGAVGVSVLQQARRIGAEVIGTASETRFDEVRKYGGVPISYGDGLAQRLRDAASHGYVAALDAVGTDEAIDTSLALVGDRSRIVTIAAFDRAERDRIKVIGGSFPASAKFRDQARAGLIKSAASGELDVPVARTYPLDQAVEALSFLAEGHPNGKLALIP